MKLPARTVFLVAAAGLLAATPPAAKSPGSSPAPESRVSIQRQIDVLLRARLRPEPLPLDLPNPFAMPGTARRDTSPSPQSAEPSTVATDANHLNAPGTNRPATSAEILADCASRLRIGGLLRFNDQVQLVINDVPRKAGDVIVMPWNDSRILIGIVSISASEFVLRYNEADLTKRF